MVFRVPWLPIVVALAYSIWPRLQVAYPVASDCTLKLHYHSSVDLLIVVKALNCACMLPGTPRHRYLLSNKCECRRRRMLH